MSTNPSEIHDGKSSELGTALWACRQAFVALALFSALINVLTLTGSLFMLQVYDRVLPSRSVPTLVGLALLTGVLFAFHVTFEMMRGRIVARIGGWLDERTSPQVFRVVVELPLTTGTPADGLRPLRDLDQIRGFLASAGPTALFDLPWIPLFLGLCFLFHPWIGITALIGAIALLTLTLSTELLVKKPTSTATRASSARAAIAEAGRKNAEVLRAMGMAGRLGAVWAEHNARYLDAQTRASDIAGGFGALSRTARMALQSAVLGVAAYLAVRQEVTAGIIVASSILSARALAPVELAIANWKNFVAARQAWPRLNALLRELARQRVPMALPPPTSNLSIDSVSMAPPGSRRLVVTDASFRLQTGQGLGIIGPSASGKSSLARAIVGVWRPVRGLVRIDGAALEQWSPEHLGQHIGYLPQDVELFAGTVAQNVARFDPQPSSDAIVAAARAADVHDMILLLPDGYDTDIGEAGAALSAGQRQRIGLARALYGDPFLVVLDEPNSNLDTEGEQALTRAILSVRERGGIAIVVAHRPSALAAVDHVLMMQKGRVQAFGPKNEILEKVTRQSPAGAGPLRVVGEQQGVAAG
jgi:PrtD family type I secretion system ABC transporter